VKTLLNRANFWRGLVALLLFVIAAALFTQNGRFIKQSHANEIGLIVIGLAFTILVLEILINSRIEAIEERKLPRRKRNEVREVDKKETAQLVLRLVPLADRVLQLDEQIQQQEAHYHTLEERKDSKKYGEAVRLASLEQYLALMDEVIFLRRQRLECRREIASIWQQMGGYTQVWENVGYDISKRVIEKSIGELALDQEVLEGYLKIRDKLQDTQQNIRRHYDIKYRMGDDLFEYDADDGGDER